MDFNSKIINNIFFYILNNIYCYILNNPILPIRFALISNHWPLSDFQYISTIKIIVFALHYTYLNTAKGGIN